MPSLPRTERADEDGRRHAMPGWSLARLALVLLVALAPSSMAIAEPAADRIAPLHDMIMDPAARFSASATLAKLDAVPVEPGSRDEGRVDHLRAIVETKVDRGADAIRHGEAALKIDAAQPFLTPGERLHLEYSVAKAQVDEKDCAAALPHYRRALALMTPASGIDEDKRLGTQQQIAYCLHEVKDFAAARDLNVTVLAKGAELYGAENPKLMGGLTNLAQNQYELGDHVGARKSLERVLSIATKVDDAGKVDESLFQLGVLAFEDGRRAEAEALMTRRLALAEAGGDEDRIARARADLDELHRRTKGP